MNEEDRKNWQDTMKETLILRGLLVELEKRINTLYEKVDEKLDVKEN